MEAGRGSEGVPHLHRYLFLRQGIAARTKSDGVPSGRRKCTAASVKSVRCSRTDLGHGARLRGITIGYDHAPFRGQSLQGTQG